MTEIRLASEELAALEIVAELFHASFSGKNHAYDHFGDAWHVLKPVLERRREDDVALGQAASEAGLPSMRTSERTGAMIRYAVDQAGMALSERIADAAVADA